jgi:transcriptional regulator with XRE-family HTH domain
MGTFAENLKKWRASKNISQEELSGKIGIHPVQLSRYERGQTTPSIDVVQKIAEALDISIDELVNGSLNKNADSNISDRELLSMFKKVQLLNDKQKDTVMDFLSAYVLKTELKQKLAHS